MRVQGRINALYQGTGNVPEIWIEHLQKIIFVPIIGLEESYSGIVVGHKV